MSGDIELNPESSHLAFSVLIGRFSAFNFQPFISPLHLHCLAL